MNVIQGYFYEQGNSLCAKHILVSYCQQYKQQDRQQQSINQNNTFQQQYHYYSQYIITYMVLFDLIVTKDNHIIATANKGDLFIWNLSRILDLELQPSNLNSSTQNVYKPSHKFSISQKAYYSISIINDSLLNIVSADSIKFYSPAKLVHKQDMAVPEFEISNAEIETKFQDYFNVVQSYNQNKLIIGSAAGKVLLYDVYKQKVESETSIEQSSGSLTQEYKNSAISAIDQLDYRIIIGTKTGSITSIDVRDLKQIGKFEVNHSTLPPVKSIINDSKSIYVGHSDMVTRWDQSGQYTGNYHTNIENSSLQKTEQQLIVGGNSPNIYRFSVNSVNQWNSSSRCILSIKKKDQMLFSCGTGKFIDIFHKSDRLCSLVAL